MHLAFLGDLGHPLDETELRPDPSADIVLAAAGVAADDRLARPPPGPDAIAPKLVLPMHYKTPKINLNIQPVERFLDVFPRRARSTGRGRA